MDMYLILDCTCDCIILSACTLVREESELDLRTLTANASKFDPDTSSYH